LPISVVELVKVEIDEELWYGASSDEAAEAEASKSMAARMGRIVGAKPFPAAAHRLSLITQDPNCSMDEVVAVLESDPALSARLLRLVNSVGFSLRTPCASVRHAAALVGTEKLHQVASTAAILDMYESGGQRARDLLEHATVVGTLCRYLAFHFGLPPDELFTCGFLHDIGKLMLLETEGPEYLEVLGPETPDFDLTHIEERKRYGFDHALLAGHVLAAWNIPHPVPKVVAWHHHVTRAYAESTAISQMVSTLRLADAMSFALPKEDTQVQIETLARMEAASYMDISEGQLAAMWEEVRALTERARAVFRGETPEETPLVVHTSRPSGASLRAVARAKNPSLRANSLEPGSSERTRQFPCVACGAPSYAHRCAACSGYMCPLHVANEDEWCQLCQSDYEAAGIPSIRPLVSTLFGALAGALVAAAFFGAASAGAQRPLRIMIGPTLILMLVGMLAGVGQRWIRRWWFLRSRPSRASIIPPAVEAVLDSVAQHNPQIVEISGLLDEPALPFISEGPMISVEEIDAAHAEQLSLMNPSIPALPALPQMDPPTVLSTAPRNSHPRERSWMSSRTPHPTAVAEPLAEPPSPSEFPESPSLAASDGASDQADEALDGSDAPAAITPESQLDAEAESEADPDREDARLAADAEPPSSQRLDEDLREEQREEQRAAAEADAAEADATEAEEDAITEEAMAEEPAALAAGGARASLRAEASVRSSANEARYSGFGARSERAVARSRASGAPRAVSERPSARPRSSNAPPPSSARARTASAPAAAPARSRSLPAANEAVVARASSSPVSSSPVSSSRAPASSSAVSSAPVSSRPSVAARPEPRPWVPPSLQPAAAAQAAAQPARASKPLEALDGAPQSETSTEGAAPRSGWTTLLDEGTAGGW
jgi:HD-like signal output (HDOD) protein